MNISFGLTDGVPRGFFQITTEGGISQEREGEPMLKTLYFGSLTELADGLFAKGLMNNEITKDLRDITFLLNSEDWQEFQDYMGLHESEE